MHVLWNTCIVVLRDRHIFQPDLHAASSRSLGEHWRSRSFTKTAAMEMGGTVWFRWCMIDFVVIKSSFLLEMKYASGRSPPPNFSLVEDERFLSGSRHPGMRRFPLFCWGHFALNHGGYGRDSKLFLKTLLMRSPSGKPRKVWATPLF